MTKEPVYIEKGQTMKDLFPDGVPSKCIIDKTIPAIGATYCEIKAPRNSIIIEPNVPVIEGKEKKHKNLLGIYGGIGETKIKEYLKRKDINHKIMTTPESYYKIKEYSKGLDIDWHKDYFLMFDECDKIIQDSNFRKSIILPFDDFFLYEEQCLISATPLTPRIKALKEFRQLKVTPLYDYSKDIILETTNNVLASLIDILNIRNWNPIVIFLNSATLILAIIKKLRIEDKTSVFCGDDAYDKLKNQGINCVSKSFTGLNKYNFFTSRFYSAVDLECKEKPDIIMISDCKTKKQTIIDPATHAIQICGRFRNGIDKIIHITNYDYNIEMTPENELIKYLEEQKHTYNLIKEKIEPIATTQGARDLLKEIRDKLSIKNYLRNDGEFDAFMVENFLNNEKVKAFYRNPEQINIAYTNTDYFNVVESDKRYDKNMGDITTKKSITKEQRKETIEKLKKLIPDRTCPHSFSFDFMFGEVSPLDKIKEEDSLTYEYYINFGCDYIDIDNYNKQKMETRLKNEEERKEKTQLPVINAILKSFNIGSGYTESEIKETLESINIKHNICLKTTVSTLKLYFKVSNRTTVTRDGERFKGYKIIDKGEFSIA
ncbi:DEAD/DEAH box helicase family protein [Dysgonomonas reticulitermitis]